VRNSLRAWRVCGLVTDRNGKLVAIY
jgi:hypothetical protein